MSFPGAIAARLPDLEDWKAQVKCQTGCPVATDAGRYVQLIAEGRDEEAFLVARAPNPFASVCGRVCAAPCEDACRRGVIDAPVAIRALKRHLTEQYGVESSRPDTQDTLRKIRTLTDRYGLPSWACAAYAALMAELEAMERDTLEHVHLENNVLAPRFDSGPLAPTMQRRRSG